MNGKKKNIRYGFVTKSDANYFPGLRNLVESLHRTNPGIPITVFNCGLQESQVDKLKDKVETIVDLNIENYKIKDIDIGRFTPSIYAAMFLEKVEYDIIFHLDADLVVLANLLSIFDRCKNNNFMGVSDYPPLSLLDQVEDENLVNYIAHAYPGMKWESTSFNGGVFCVKKTFYVEKMLPRIREFSQYHMQFKTNDQALLNLAYASRGEGDFPDLGILYNFRPNFSRAPHIKLSKTSRTEDEIIVGEFKRKPIKILHFIRENKPWIEGFDKNSLEYTIWNQFSGNN